MSYRLPPGKYYIGDPCYVMQDGTWDELLNEHHDHLSHGEIVEFKGAQLWAHGTAHGDGAYADQNDAEYTVDSGMLGVVPLALIDDPAGEEGGVVMDFPKGLTVEYCNGTFFIGPICIRTDYLTDDEDFEDDEVDGGYDGDLGMDRLFG